MVFILPMLAIMAGIGLILSGAFRHPRRRRRMLIGATMVALPVLEGSRMAYIESGLDINPVIGAPSEIEGVWRHGGTELELAAGGVWRCLRSERNEQPCDGTANEGRWSIADNSVTFVSASGADVGELLVFRYRGAYRLVHNFGDPDDWNHSLDYERVGRAASRSANAGY